MVDIDEFGVPLVNDLRQICGAERLLDLRRRVVFLVLSECDHFLHDGLVNLGDGDLIISATVLDEAVDQHRLLGRVHVNFNDLVVFDINLQVLLRTVQVVRYFCQLMIVTLNSLTALSCLILS